MAKRFGVLEADEPLNAEPRKHVAKNVALYLVRKLLAVQVSPRIIKMVTVSQSMTLSEAVKIIGFYDGPMGTGNVLPFSRPTDSQHHSHYEIPMAGDRTCFARHRRKLLRPNARKWRHQGAPVIPVVFAAAQ